MSKQNAKNLVLPHSEAKLEMYRSYLLKYIQILVASQRFQQINLYDVFCGSGIYENGKAGSPVLAFEAIRQNRVWCSSNSKNPTSIKLSVNDVDNEKVEKVEQHLRSQPQPVECTLDFNSQPAKDFMLKVLNEVTSKGQGVRNLIFIDPYGYKEIEAKTIVSLLGNGITEIILFLPVSFIYRFANVAQSDKEVIQYEHLRVLISSFFDSEHPIRLNSPIEFIRSLKEAMTFNSRFYSASYFIEREKGNYFALFFMTSNLLGLQKFLETKWETDPVKGQGYKMPDRKGPGLFDTQFEEEDRDERVQTFGKELERFLKMGKQSDKSIYEFTLSKEFLPEHTNSILKQWQKIELLEVWDIKSKKPARQGSFNINYDSTKTAGSKFTFKLK